MNIPCQNYFWFFSVKNVSLGGHFFCKVNLLITSISEKLKFLKICPIFDECQQLNLQSTVVSFEYHGCTLLRAMAFSKTKDFFLKGLNK